MLCSHEHILFYCDVKTRTTSLGCSSFSKLLFTMPRVTVCYVLMNISYFTVMSKQELLLSAAVASVSRLLQCLCIIELFGYCKGGTS